MDLFFVPLKHDEFAMYTFRDAKGTLDLKVKGDQVVHKVAKEVQASLDLKDQKGNELVVDCSVMLHQNAE